MTPEMQNMMQQMMLQQMMVNPQMKMSQMPPIMGLGNFPSKPPADDTDDPDDPYSHIAPPSTNYVGSPGQYKSTSSKSTNPFKKQSPPQFQTNMATNQKKEEFNFLDL